MSVRVEEGVVWLEGDCRAADAEALCAALIGQGSRRVELSRALRLHTAVVQALLALRPEVAGEPADAFLRTHVAPRLRTLP